MTSVAFHALVDAHFHRIHRAALGFLGKPEEAREVAQEALLKAHRAREAYDPTLPFYPWLYRILKNTCLDAIARRRHRATPGLDAERVGADGPSSVDRIATAEEVRALWRAMETLPEEHKEILNLRHFQDLAYDEIAEVLAIPRGTVMSRLFRARRALARRMTEEA